MSPFPWSQMAILVALILLNGVFSMSELAIVSARPARLRLAAGTALQLAPEVAIGTTGDTSY